MSGCRGLGRGRNGERLLSGWVSLGGDENVPELEGGDENMLKTIKLYASKWVILWYVSFPSVKKQNRQFIKMAT